MVSSNLPDNFVLNISHQNKRGLQVKVLGAWLWLLLSQFKVDGHNSWVIDCTGLPKLLQWTVQEYEKYLMDEISF